VTKVKTIDLNGMAAKLVTINATLDKIDCIEGNITRP
jgi:hypothetical protein